MATFGNEEVSKREKTLPKGDLDESFYGPMITKLWRQTSDSLAEYHSKRELWTNNWRDFESMHRTGAWENSANFHFPYAFTLGKSTHARLWQLFTNQEDFFDVDARNENFQDRAPLIKMFMNWILSDWSNRREGIRDAMDEWLWDIVFEGSGILKGYWDREEQRYKDVDVTIERGTSNRIDRETLEIVETPTSRVVEEDIETIDIFEAPAVGRIFLEDFILPTGHSNPQLAPWCIHRVEMSGEEIRNRAKQGKFNKETAAEAIMSCEQPDSSEQGQRIKQLRDELDGVIHDHFGVKDDVFNATHVVLEFYGKAIVNESVSEADFQDIDQSPQEVVIWVHEQSSKILGWTYLSRVSPGGIRPFFKADFVRMPGKSFGTGVGEMLFQLNEGMDSVFNLRMDSSTIAATPWGLYRNTSSIKPDLIQYEPGTLYPSDDPQNDVRMMQFPTLSNFGVQEMAAFSQTGRDMVNIRDLDLGQSPNSVGLFRTASGSNLASQSSQVQLDIHFDRIARALAKFMQFIFKLVRERMPDQLHFRVAGTSGKPIFQTVTRDDLKGEFDFRVNVDILGQSKDIAQQQAMLISQFLINPVFLQSGVVNQQNLYWIARNVLKRAQVAKMDQYITKPEGMPASYITPENRIFKIVLNDFEGIEDTVRMDEDHAQALRVYEGFKNDDDTFGLLTNDAQLMALESLIRRHQELQVAIQQSSVPNATGSQIPQDGMSPVGALLGGQNVDTAQGSLGSPLGEAAGPAV